jgi:capsular polysaccharide biosynthesis protein
VIDISWRIEDEDRELELTGAPQPLLGTWHYLRNSLRREWRTWGGLAALGAVLGLAFVVLVPSSSKASVLLLMAHPANLDSQSAMATDVSLLNTREVATRTVAALNLDMAPEAFQGTVSAEPVTTEILSIAVSAPDDEAATARANALTEQYLDFRATQLRSLSSGLIEGYQSRVQTAREQVSRLTGEYSQAAARGPDGQTLASEILSRRAELNAQIVEMQQAIEEAALTADAAIASTHVIDPATVGKASLTKRLALQVVSGLIAGTALGVGLVLFRALTSNRLRRRRDVGLALGAPVRFAVASRGASEWRLRLGRWIRPSWQARDLDALVHGLTLTLPRHGGTTLTDIAATPRRAAGVDARPSGVALAAINNPRAAAVVLGALAVHLRGLGQAVLLVDLSPSGALADHMSSQRSGRGWARRATADDRLASSLGPDPMEFRPDGAVGLARGLRGAPAAPLGELPKDQELQAKWAAADIVLVLADVDPGLDAENLRSWVTQVVPLVTAGLSSPELLQTTAELIRAAGLDLPFAMMVGSDDTDESLGLVDSDIAERAAAPRPT